MIFAVCLVCLACEPQSPVARPPPAQVTGLQQLDTSPSAREERAAHWSFTLEPFLWLAGIDGRRE